MDPGVDSFRFLFGILFWGCFFWDAFLDDLFDYLLDVVWVFVVGILFVVVPT